MFRFGKRKKELSTTEIDIENDRLDKAINHQSRLQALEQKKLTLKSAQQSNKKTFFSTATKEKFSRIGAQIKKDYQAGKKERAKKFGLK